MSTGISWTDETWNPIRGCSRVSDHASLDWLIAGCESGPGARPCDVAWLRSLRDQCAAAGTPFFLKQAIEQTLSHRLYPSGAAAVAETPVVAFGSGSKRKPRGVIELPYLDGVQHAEFQSQGL